MLIEAVLMTLALVPPGNDVDPCGDPDSSRQIVIAEGAGDMPELWYPQAGEIHPLEFANGASLGVEVAPVNADFYRERIGEREAYLESVRISIHDLSQDPPALLSTTYGGADSIQGFSARGGANAIQALGEETLRLQLIKPNCVKASELVAGND